MIDVTITYKDNMILSLNITGHANYAPAGKDIVCAAISALTNTLEETFEEFAIPVKKVQEGWLLICPDTTTEILMKSYQIGIDLIAHAYPDNVTLHLVY